MVRIGRECGHWVRGDKPLLRLAGAQVPDHHLTAVAAEGAAAAGGGDTAYVLGPAEAVRADGWSVLTPPKPATLIGAPVFSVQVNFDPGAMSKLLAMTKRLSRLQAPRNHLAIVVNSNVLVDLAVVAPLDGKNPVGIPVGREIEANRLVAAMQNSTV